MQNERKSSPLRFTPEHLQKLGFYEVTPGQWAKSPTPAVGGLGADQHRQPARALDKKTPAKRSRQVRRPRVNIRDRAPLITVTMTAHLFTRMDDDNLANALKPLRDELAEWIGVDDADGRVRWEPRQVETRGSQGVAVRVERRDP